MTPVHPDQSPGTFRLLLVYPSSRWSAPTYNNTAPHLVAINLNVDVRSLSSLSRLQQPHFSTDSLSLPVSTPRTAARFCALAGCTPFCQYCTAGRPRCWQGRSSWGLAAGSGCWSGWSSRSGRVTTCPARMAMQIRHRLQCLYDHCSETAKSSMQRTAEKQGLQGLSR